MGKIIVNKHINSKPRTSAEMAELKDMFHPDKKASLGEIVVSNDPNDPAIYIKDLLGDVRRVSGGGSGEGGGGSEYNFLIADDSLEYVNSGNLVGHRVKISKAENNALHLNEGENGGLYVADKTGKKNALKMLPEEKYGEKAGLYVAEAAAEPGTIEAKDNSMTVETDPMGVSQVSVNVSKKDGNALQLLSGDPEGKNGLYVSSTGNVEFDGKSIEKKGQPNIYGVKVSEKKGNSLILLSGESVSSNDGLYVAETAAGSFTEDNSTIVNSGSPEDPVYSVKISKDPENALKVKADIEGVSGGLFVEKPKVSSITTDENTIYNTGSSENPSYAVKVSNKATNALNVVSDETVSNGLFVDSDKFSPKVSADEGNAITISDTDQGIFVAKAKEYAFNKSDNSLAGDDASGFKVNISEKDGNIIKLNADDPSAKEGGIYAELPEFSKISLENKSITETAGKNGTSVYKVNISEKGGNKLSLLDEAGSEGLYVAKQEMEVSAEPENAIEKKADGLFVAKPEEYVFNPADKSIVEVPANPDVPGSKTGYKVNVKDDINNLLNYDEQGLYVSKETLMSEINDLGTRVEKVTVDNATMKSQLGSKVNSVSAESANGYVTAVSELVEKKDPQAKDASSDTKDYKITVTANAVKIGDVADMIPGKEPDELNPEGTPDIPAVDGLAIASDVKTYIEKADKYTVNGKAVSTNPVIYSTEMSVSEQKEGYKIGAPTFVSPEDKVSDAIGKIEANVYNQNLLMAAAINDMNGRMVGDLIAEDDGSNELFPGMLYDLGELTAIPAFTFNTVEIKDNVSLNFKARFKASGEGLTLTPIAGVKWSKNTQNDLTNGSLYLMEITARKMADSSIELLGRTTEW